MRTIVLLLAAIVAFIGNENLKSQIIWEKSFKADTMSSLIVQNLFNNKGYFYLTYWGMNKFNQNSLTKFINSGVFVANDEGDSVNHFNFIKDKPFRLTSIRFDSNLNFYLGHSNYTTSVLDPEFPALYRITTTNDLSILNSFCDTSAEILTAYLGLTYQFSGDSIYKWVSNDGGLPFMKHWLVVYNLDGKYIREQEIQLPPKSTDYTSVSYRKNIITKNKEFIFITSAANVQTNSKWDYTYITKIDSNGNQVWSKTFQYDSVYKYYLNAVELQNGDIIISGGSIPKVNQPGILDMRLSLLRITANGDVVWEKEYPSMFLVDVMNGMKSIQNENYLVLYGFTKINGNDTLNYKLQPGEVEQNYFCLITITPDGNLVNKLVWASGDYNSKEEIGNNIIADVNEVDGKLYVYGKKDSLNVYLAQIDPLIVNVDDKPKQLKDEVRITIKSNQTDNPQILIENPNHHNLKIKITDILGRRILEKYITNNNDEFNYINLVENIKNIPPGVYLIFVEYKNGFVSRKFINF